MSQLYQQQIKQNSQEWNQITYTLLSLSGNTAIKIIQIFKYVQKQSISFQSKNKFDALVDITDFKKQYKSKVINHNLPCQDIIFHCGHINIEKYKMEPSKILRYLVCKVSLGVIGDYKQSSNYLDSILIQPQDKNQPFNFNFLVNNHNQYEANYQIAFILDYQNNQNVNKAILCSNCQKLQAQFYCKEDKEYYCKPCQQKYDANRTNISSTKKPQPLHPNPFQKLNRTNTLPLCDSHKVMHEFYCLKCQKYVCSICIQKGTHSQNASHIIKPLQIIFSLKSQENSSAGQNHLSKLQNILKSVQNKSKDITENYKQTKTRLTNQFQRALSRLQHLYKEKIIKIWSNQIQITFLKQKIQWQKAIISHFQKILKPINYFKMQTKFYDKIANLKVDGFQNTFTIDANIDCYIDVVVDEKQQIKEYIKTKTKTNLVSPINSIKSNRSDFTRNDMLLRFDEKNEFPKSGELSLMLQNSNLHFFKSIFGLYIVANYQTGQKSLKT